MNWVSLVCMGLAATWAASKSGYGPLSWIPLGLVVLAGALYAAYRRGYSDGGDEMERLYKQYPPRCHHDGCLCVYGAMQDNPACPWHGESERSTAA